ncbi:MAG: hypothetical protein ACR2LM_01395 [Pyrinomonadaceae bacterium]
MTNKLMGIAASSKTQVSIAAEVVFRLAGVYRIRETRALRIIEAYDALKHVKETAPRRASPLSKSGCSTVHL